MASSNLTWGISGPEFLAGYGLLALVSLVGVVIVRWRLAAGSAGASAVQPREQPHDIAYLNGGPQLAVLSALSSMRVAGTVSAYSDGTVRAEQSLDSNADELQQAIWMATADGPITRGDLVTHWIVATTLRKTRQRLEDAGLLLSADEQRRIKRAGWWMVGVGVVGVVRLVAGAAKGAPVNDLIQELFGVGIVAAVLLLRSAPRCSRRGTAELKRLRTEHHELAPGMRPDWTAYGPALAGLGVGIFGAKALWASDPAFAADIHAQQLAAGAGRFNYYGGGCGGGGGGCGGGGGGCGGGCGGGGGH